MWHKTIPLVLLIFSFFGHVEGNGPEAICKSVSTLICSETGQIGVFPPIKYDGGSRFSGSGMKVRETEPAEGTELNLGKNIITLTVTDKKGRNHSCETFHYVTKDQQDPTITCPDNITRNASNGECSAPVPFAPIANDNCVQYHITYVPKQPGAAFNVGTTEVKAMISDEAGNTDECSFHVTILDDQDPTIECPTNVEKVADVDQCSARVPFKAFVGDNCDESFVSYAPLQPGSVFQVGKTLVTALATDATGRQSQCTFNVTVIDDQDPKVQCPANLTFTAPADQCSSMVYFPTSKSDNCPGLTITYEPKASGSQFDVGETAVTVSVIDAAGRQKQCSFYVTVLDEEDPTIQCPGDVTRLADGRKCSTRVSSAATGSDNCDGQTITYSPKDPGSFFTVGDTVQTATITDNSGRYAQCTFSVKVVDRQTPTIECPTTITTATDSDLCSAVVQLNATGRDNCEGLSVDFTPKDSGSEFEKGQTTVTAKATDGAGNTEQCSFDVIVTDNQQPSIACPVDIPVNTDVGQCSAVVQFVAGISDNCPGETVAYAPKTSGDAFGVGSSTVTATVTDTSGESNMCTFDVTVTDMEDPTIECPADILTVTAPRTCAANVTFSVNASDNCEGFETTYSPKGPGSKFEMGSTVVTATVTDAAGRNAECSFMVTVADEEIPTVQCPLGRSLKAAEDQCSAAVIFEAIPSDNCGEPTLNYVPKGPGSEFDVGKTTVTASATDSTGNTKQCSFQVTVTAYEETWLPVLCLDEEDPTIQCPEDKSTVADNGRCSTIVTYEATGSDNCAVANISYEIITPRSLFSDRSIFSHMKTSLRSSQKSSSFFVRINRVEARIIDSAGRKNMCSFNIIVEDQQPPTIQCPANITKLLNSSSGCSEVVSFETRGSDNCDEVVISYDPKGPGSAFDVGETVVVATATDSSSNEATCVISIAIEKENDLNIQCPNSKKVVPVEGKCSVPVQFAATSSTCGGKIVYEPQDPNTSFEPGTTIVTATLNDPFGRKKQCSFNITVEDNVAPVALCQDIRVQLDANGHGSITGGDIDGGSSDACGISSLTPSKTTFDCSNIGTNTVTLTVTDINGHVSTCNSAVTVKDPCQNNGTIKCNTETGKMTCDCPFGVYGGALCNESRKIFMAEYECKNATDVQDLYMAVVYLNTDNQWVTDGWFILKPGEDKFITYINEKSTKMFTFSHWTNKNVWFYSVPNPNEEPFQKCVCWDWNVPWTCPADRCYTEKFTYHNIIANKARNKLVNRCTGEDAVFHRYN